MGKKVCWKKADPKLRHINAFSFKKKVKSIYKENRIINVNNTVQLPDTIVQ